MYKGYVHEFKIKSPINRIRKLLVRVVMLYSLLFTIAAGQAATLVTDKDDYRPGATAIITGDGFQGNETVQLQVVHADGTPDTGEDHEPWQVTATNGHFVTTWSVCTDDCVGSLLQVTAIGLSSSLTAQAFFTDANVGIDFSQYVNGNFGTNDASWIAGAINGNKALYAEGMCIPQRLFLLGIDSSTTTNHSLEIQVLATKGGVHAYDFVTSWDQAIASANFIAPGLNLMANLITARCTNAIGADASAVCAGLHTSINQTLAVYTQELTNVPGFPAGDYPTGDRVQSRAEAFDIFVGGSRGARVYADPTATNFSNVHFSFDGYVSGAGEYYEVYTLTWTSDSTNLLIELAGHLAQSKDQGQNLAYPATGGSSKVNGGPYHFKLSKFDGGNLSSQDNQIQVNNIFQPPFCGVSPGLTNICTGGSATFVGSVLDGGTAPFTYQWRGTNSNGDQILSTNIVTSSTNTSITVSNAGTYSLLIIDSIGLTSLGGCSGILVVQSPASASALSGQAACPGGSATFCTTITGTPPFSITWTKNGTNPPVDPRIQITSSTTNSCLTITNVAAGDAAQYCVIVSNFCARVTNCASLTIDTNLPALNCPTNLSVQCVGDVPAPGANFVGDQRSTNGCTITITRTYASTNACGQTTNCTQTITVHDTLAPSIICPTNISVQCLSNVPPAATTIAQFIALGGTVSDNCDTNLTLSVSNSPLTGGTCGGTIVRTYTATDHCTNSASCTQTITVKDTLPPSITCPAPISVQCLTNVPPGTTNIAEFITLGGTLSDNCATNLTLTFSNSPLSGGVCGGTILRTYTVTDECTNSGSCTQTITVKDTLAPTINCPTNISVQCISNVPPRPSSLAQFLALGGTATDNCDTALDYSCSDSPLIGDTCGGMILRTHKVTDDCTNTASCVQIITIRDTTPPSITCPSNITVQCLSNVPPAAANLAQFLTLGGTASDNCDTNLSLSVSNSPLIGSQCGGFILRVYTVTDDCTNSASCTQTITVKDTTPPSITCPAGFTVQCVTNLPPRPTTLAQFLALGGTVSDNCDTNLSYSSSDGPLVGGLCGGTITRTHTVTDRCTNSASCTQVFTIHDTTPPTLLSGPTNKTILCSQPIVFSDTNVIRGIDNCDTNLSVVVSVADDVTVDGQNQIVHTRCWRLLDDCSNYVEVCQSITIANCSVEHCSLTQGAYGNSGGKWNGIPRLDLIKSLLTVPGMPNVSRDLVIGKPGRSLRIPLTSAACIIRRLPAGGPADTLPTGYGDQTLNPESCQTTPALPLDRKNIKFRNVFIGQLITLSLNTRLDASLLSFTLTTNQFCTVGALPGPDGKIGTSDDLIDFKSVQFGGSLDSHAIPMSVINTLMSDATLGNSVAGLLELANRAIAGQATGSASLGDIMTAVSAINEAFDECRFVVPCNLF